MNTEYELFDLICSVQCYFIECGYARSHSHCGGILPPYNTHYSSEEKQFTNRFGFERMSRNASHQFCKCCGLGDNIPDIEPTNYHIFYSNEIIGIQFSTFISLSQSKLHLKALVIKERKEVCFILQQKNFLHTRRGTLHLQKKQNVLKVNFKNKFN